MNSLKFPIAAAAVTTAMVMATAVAHAEEVVVEHRTPDVQVSQTRPNSAMLSSGIVGVAVPYLASVVVGAESSHPGDRNLFVPVAGPWMDLSDRHCQLGSSCNHEGLYKGLLVVDGIFQGLGALEIVGAFLFPERVTVTNASRSTPTRTAGVHFTPSSVGGGYGLAAVGAF
ncbi:MAG TPA: hypothetical protein VH062_25035 [Polyangiaceae bacterium]|nr:hypothetical protein [Polyangiaceae bacterium]